MSSRISDAFVQRKRIAHRPKTKSDKADTIKASPSKETTPSRIGQKELQLLKQFDLTLEFGPCMAITRLERWERAQRHGLNPPKEVKDLIDQHPDDPLYTESLWHDYNTLLM